MSLNGNTAPLLGTYVSSPLNSGTPQSNNPVLLVASRRRRKRELGRLPIDGSRHWPGRNSAQGLDQADRRRRPGSAVVLCQSVESLSCYGGCDLSGHEDALDGPVSPDG